MDVVYLLGKGSPFNNEELKYSLRSLDVNGKNVDRLILVGEKPSFLDYSKVIHVPFVETGVKDYRIASKIMHVCQEEIVVDNFLFCNDDFFFTRPFNANAYPYYHKGSLLNGLPQSAYQEHLKLTKDFLIHKGFGNKHFDVHCPIIYNADKFLSLADVWEYSKNTIGLTVKSIYANMNGIVGEPYMDVKLKQLLTDYDYSMVSANVCFSIYDEAWNKGVKDFLEKRFTTKSKWEL